MGCFKGTALPKQAMLMLVRLRGRHYRLPRALTSTVSSSTVGKRSAATETRDSAELVDAWLTESLSLSLRPETPARAGPFALCTPLGTLGEPSCEFASSDMLEISSSELSEAAGGATGCWSRLALSSSSSSLQMAGGRC